MGLRPKHPCSIDLNEIFHKEWYQGSLRKFEITWEPLTLNEENKEMMDAYYKHLESVNRDIWDWYHSAIPSGEFMDKLYKFLNEYLLVQIHKTLNLPNNKGTTLNKMVSVFGSISYGLFIHKFSDIDIGVNLHIVERTENKKKSLTSNPDKDQNGKVIK